MQTLTHGFLGPLFLQPFGAFNALDHLLSGPQSGTYEVKQIPSLRC